MHHDQPYRQLMNTLRDVIYNDIHLHNVFNSHYMAMQVPYRDRGDKYKLNVASSHIARWAGLAGPRSAVHRA